MTTRFGMIGIALGASLAFSSMAHAQSQLDQRLPKAFSVKTDKEARAGQIGPQLAAKGLKLDATTGRWGLQLDLSQTSRRTMDWQNVQAGAFYRVSPSLRVGGAVGVGADPENLAAKARTQSAAVPRIKLETAFKF